MLNKSILFLGSLLLALNVTPVLADGDHHRGGNNECPVESPYTDGSGNTVSFSMKFGADVEQSMRCTKQRHKVKIVVQVNDFCRSHVANINECGAGRAFALGNMKNMINDMEKTNGMKRGRDYKMIAVVHSGGGHLLRKFTGPGVLNPYTDDVKELMDMGVEFYFCLNTAAGFIGAGALPAGNISAAMVDPRVKYVPAGLTAITDFQNTGYTYVQP